MEISPDIVVYARMGPFSLNATILFTWLVMAFLVTGSWLVTRRLSSASTLSRQQHLLEILVLGIRDQIQGICRQEPDAYLPFVGTLFLFIAASNILTIIPGFRPPTGSLSTTAGLALCVLIAVPIFGIAERGLAAYLRHYVTPSLFMLPFNILGEISRTIALAVRLFGNVMSGTTIVGILVSLAPLFFPVVMEALGLLVGMVQAYIFAVLAMVYIASATRSFRERSEPAGKA